MKNKFSICSFLLALALSVLVSFSAQAQAWDPVRLTGPVTAYTPADCGKDGSIKIAGQTLVIAAGADTLFLDSMLTTAANGGLEIANVKSEKWQVVNTVRAFGVYLDSKNRVRKQFTTSTPGSTTAARAFDITGIVEPSPAGTIKIHGLTFTIATGSSVPVVAGPNLVRIVGTINSSNELTGPVVGGVITTTALVLEPYRKLTLCGAPALYFSTGFNFEVPDTNSFDAAGPISGQVFVFNPQGTSAVEYLCDEGQEILRWDGTASIPVAPNFSIRQDISKDVNACYELQIDAFGEMTTGSKKISGTGNSVTGVLSAAVVQGFTGPFPTTRNEAAQRGSVVISGVAFTIAPNNTVTIIGGPVVGDQVTMIPKIDPSGQNGSPLAPGWPFPPRAGNLINGTTLTKQ